MKVFEKFEKGIFFRLLLSAALAFIALGLFLLSRNALQQPTVLTREDFTATLKDIDREVDSVFVRFGIAREWVRKRTVELENSPDRRIERRVTIPPTIPSVQVNVALNTMARRYNGRAVATENLKENSVTIHIELNKRIIETIILTVKTDLKLRSGKNGRLNV